MVLGRGHHVPAHLIDEKAPGTAYVVLENRRTVKVRADYYSDRLLVAIGKRWRPPVDVTSLTVVPDGVAPRRRSHASLTPPRRRGTAEHNAELAALGVAAEPELDNA